MMTELAFWARAKLAVSWSCFLSWGLWLWLALVCLATAKPAFWRKAKLVVYPYCWLSVGFQERVKVFVPQECGRGKSLPLRRVHHFSGRQEGYQLGMADALQHLC